MFTGLLNNKAKRLKQPLGFFFSLIVLTIFNRAFADELNPTNWNENVAVTTGIGYKDNVFLTHTPTGGSGFLLTGVDADFFKLPGNGWEVFFLISGYDSLYWNNPTTGHEDLWTAAVDVRKKIAPKWTVGALALYAYEGMVVDLASEEDVEAPPAKIS